MRDHGFIVHSTEGYVITPAGADLTRRMSDFPAFASKWQSAQAKQRSAKSGRPAKYALQPSLVKAFFIPPTIAAYAGLT